MIFPDKKQLFNAVDTGIYVFSWFSSHTKNLLILSVYVTYLEIQHVHVIAQHASRCMLAKPISLQISPWRHF